MSNNTNKNRLESDLLTQDNDIDLRPEYQTLRNYFQSIPAIQPFLEDQLINTKNETKIKTENSQTNSNHIKLNYIK